MQETNAQLVSLLKGLQLKVVERSATNLRLLHDHLQDVTLLADILDDARTSADADAALNFLERCMGSIDPQEFRAVLNTAARRRQLLTVLGGSAFLAGLFCRDGDCFNRLFLQQRIDCPSSEADMITALRQRVDPTAPFEALKRELRVFKREQILRIGSRDLCGMAALEEVTAELSSLASAALQVAYEVCSVLLQKDYGEPLQQTDEGQKPAAFCVLGMGKFGGNELNFSSDIDLIYCYSSPQGMTTGGDREKDGIELHRYFVKLAELLTRALGQVTEDGFVFRVDTRLRPDGNNGDLAVSISAAEIYYESWGQSWERAAMLKARPVAGCLELGEELLHRLEPFVYRRYLDFGMIEDIQIMKQKINLSLGRKQEGDNNLKLGRGGIREIEFFIQALQLVNAGKKPHLRERNSLQALELLCQDGLISSDEKEQLVQAYRFLRTVEHRIQIVQERQTHSLPTKEDDLLVLARRCGFAGCEEFLAELERLRTAVHALFNELFHAAETEADDVRPEVTFVLDVESDPDLVKDVLEENGFGNPDAAYDALRFLRGSGPDYRLTERGSRCLERLAPLMMTALLDSPSPDQALNNLERFLQALRAKTSFFSLLVENPKIVSLLLSLFGSSQLLSRIFIQRPELLDTMVSSSYATSFKPQNRMAEELTEQMALATDYEQQLDVLRRYRNEEFLRIALNDLQGQIGQTEGTVQLSWLANVCLAQAVRMGVAELTVRYGMPSQAGGTVSDLPFAIVGMGKLGGLELAYHSDLDIIFIYEGEGQTEAVTGTDPERFRSINNRDYYARLAQRIITVLTLVTREGFVYKIDTRLRPSGNQGPLVTSLHAFEDYHQQSAQPWERQALTKALVVCAPDSFGRRCQAIIEQLTFDRPLPPHLQQEIFRLRGRMEREIAREGSDHFNIKTGRGGLVDIEFLTQYLQLLHAGNHLELRSQNTLRVLKQLENQELLTPHDSGVLIEGYKFLRRLENKLRLIHDQSISQLSGDAKALRRVALSLGYPARPKPPETLFLEEYRRTTESIRALFAFYLEGKNDHEGDR
ncbi:MAG: bifunctional [glutamate--ammonia ligase]-adenylyl-L-tyrosine phosphorylase/[glutamate--ammonia-ligase] adenylyltransferase [Desulfuromonas sp.]|nr:MAG: bifunctional [glutamate--ammonia ligase]-adenylyl-L-tyrosine phosphorylase/[glutamate--ammonia-ligase] adenylyltransferase [Desulfuromonas sp.]